MTESEFVVTLSLHRDWYSPAQAKRVLDMAISEGLVDVEDETDAVQARFDPAEVELPAEFVPDEQLLQERSIFESMLARIVEAGHDKRTAVAEINAIQRDHGITVEAAAALYAATHGVDLERQLERASRTLRARVHAETTAE